jgi:hypothetical protein
MSLNPNISTKFIEDSIDREWNWDYLSRNPAITPSFVRKHISRGWDWYWLSDNTFITPDFIEENVKRMNPIPLSFNPAINLQFVLRHLNWKWNFDNLSKNPSITLEDILTTREMTGVWERWNWRSISERQPNIEKTMKDHPDLPWDRQSICLNPSLSDEYRENHILDSVAEAQYFSMNCNPWLVERFPELVWRWDLLSENPRIMRVM